MYYARLMANLRFSIPSRSLCTRQVWKESSTKTPSSFVLENVKSFSNRDIPGAKGSSLFDESKRFVCIDVSIFVFVVQIKIIVFLHHWISIERTFLYTLHNNDLICSIEALYKPDTFKHLNKRRRDLNIHSSFRRRERGIKYSIYRQEKRENNLWGLKEGELCRCNVPPINEIKVKSWNV